MQRRKFYILSLSTFTCFCIFFYLLHLNNIVTSTFEGRRYVIPSRVYSRPLEIFQDKKLSKSRVLYELRQLDYRKTEKLTAPGQYKKSKNGLTIWKRAFSFWDEKEDALLFSLRWNKEKLAVLDEAEEPLNSPVRLEAIDIGGIYPRVIEDRILLRYDEIPELLKLGLPAVEDRTFFEHYGLKPSAIMRAAIINLKKGRIVQGGSTLTQQLIKNLFLTSKQNFTRKAVEAIMALELELQYSKEDILETYINEVYFGQNGSRSINGFGLASQRFFGKSLTDLSTGDIATLVGMLKGPNYYDPRRYPERTVKRRDIVLSLWRDQGIIDDMEYEESITEAFVVRPKAELTISKFPDFIDLVKKHLSKAYSSDDLSGSGFKIFTSLDPYLQLRAEDALKRQIRRYKSRDLVGALITVDAFDGGVLTFVGRTDKNTFSYFNRALYASRPIGSLIKPFVYLSALKNGYNLASMISDEPIELEEADGSIWSPQNYDKESHGEVMLIDALAKSYNQATVRLGLDIGLDKVFNEAEAVGLDKPEKLYPSMLLGSIELSPFEVIKMFQPISSGGFKIPISPIRSVLNYKGEVIKSFPIKIRRVLTADYSYLISKALRRVVTSGTSKGLNYVKGLSEIGAKTGTTQGERDAWFVGLGDKMLSVVWLGNDENRPIGLTGASGALPVFSSIAKDIDYGNLLDNEPTNLELKEVDPKGRILVGGCKGLSLPFKEGELPLESVNCSKTEQIKGWFKKILK